MGSMPMQPLCAPGPAAATTPYGQPTAYALWQKSAAAGRHVRPSGEE